MLQTANFVAHRRGEGFPEIKTKKSPILKVLFKVSLHTLTLLLIHLPELRVLDHNQLHEALNLLHRTSTDGEMPTLKVCTDLQLGVRAVLQKPVKKRLKKDV